MNRATEANRAYNHGCIHFYPHLPSLLTGITPPNSLSVAAGGYECWGNREASLARLALNLLLRELISKVPFVRLNGDSQSISFLKIPRIKGLIIKLGYLAVYTSKLYTKIKSILILHENYTASKCLLIYF